MDSHSLHEFMIRYGQTLSSTPEFMSYQRVYAAVWPVLAELILQLEGICAEYAVPLVVVDGKVCWSTTPVCCVTAPVCCFTNPVSFWIGVHTFAHHNACQGQALQPSRK